MKRTKWIVGLRNTISSLAMECDSCAAIEATQMTPAEREKLQSMLRKAVEYIDKRIIAKK